LQVYLRQDSGLWQFAQRGGGFGML